MVTQENSTTPFFYKCEILGTFLLLNHSDFEEFYLINDVAPCLALGISEGYVSPEEKGIELIEETWEDFLKLFGQEDTGYTKLDEILTKSGWYDGWQKVNEPEEEDDNI